MDGDRAANEFYLSLDASWGGVEGGWGVWIWWISRLAGPRLILECYEQREGVQPRGILSMTDMTQSSDASIVMRSESFALMRFIPCPIPTRGFLPITKFYGQQLCTILNPVLPYSTLIQYPSPSHSCPSHPPICDIANSYPRETHPSIS